MGKWFQRRWAAQTGFCLVLGLFGNAGAFAPTEGGPAQAGAQGNAPDPSESDWQAARSVGARIAHELAQHCPATAPGDQSAFDACRQALFGNSALRETLAPIALWGRQRDPKMPLKQASLTQFAPDVLAGMYLPLFMFNGEHTVQYVKSEGLFQIRLSSAFRNRLSPGQFPYPFWHDAEKWSMYQNANDVLLWWDARTARIRVAQFTVYGDHAPIIAVEQVPQHAFDGKWMWSDAQGQTQPKVTLFDGLYRPNNPYLPKLDGAYKTLALRLREGQCNNCHVPNNPDHAKRLVLLQTPAHAAAEIRRVLKSVREDRMPRDETGIEAPLGEDVKRALLEDGEAFAKLVDAARRWENDAVAGR